MKKMLGTGAMLLLIIYLLPIGCRVYAGTAPTDTTKDVLAVYAENGALSGAGQAGGAGVAAGQADGGLSDPANPYDNINNQGSAASPVWSTAQSAGATGTAGGDASGGGSAGLATGATGAEAHDVLAEGQITVLVNGEPQVMALETYVEGVVAAEISPDFPEEAIKAQAVAARTYAVYKANAGRPMQHRNADVCDDYRHCAAYIDLATAASARWGDNAESNVSIIHKAVQETAGEIVVKDGEAIVAVFHAASAARTESAKDIWGTDISYLQSVASPGGSACAQYEGTVRLTFDAFRAKALENYPTADLSGDPNRWFSASTRSEAGSVIVCTMGGVQVRGTDLRTVFGLNSTNFTLTIDDETISFHTVGYGHGVGLSQYGAKYLAEQGSDYKDILTHYYTGTEIVKTTL